MAGQIGQILFIYVFVMAVFLFALVAYVIEGYGIRSIAQKLGRNDGWIGFVPVARRYLEGCFVKQGTGIWMVSLPAVILFALLAGWVAALIVWFAVQVYYGFTRYELFRKYSNNAILHASLSTVVPFYFSIVIAVFGIKM